MFAPRHAVTARELARVLRPGGRLAVTAWTPEGAMGRFFRAMGSFLPAPPPVAEPPVLWGAEDHVRELFAGTGVELEFERDALDPPAFDSTDAALEFLTGKFGPLIMAKRVTEESGRWPELRALLADFYERAEPAEYLMVVGRRALSSR
jgi:SAM-dependent methyltransferase